MKGFILPIKYSIPTSKIKSFITTRKAGNFKKVRDLGVTRGKQVHSAKVRVVREKDAGRQFPATDGLITDLLHIPLAVFTADCVPIFLYDPGTNSIGMVHAGREGTKKRILEKTVRKMTKFYKIKCENLLVSFGPHICKNCYPFDLSGENLAQLLKLGVKRKNVKLSKTCTYEDPRFFSYRREGENAGRMMSAIVGL